MKYYLATLSVLFIIATTTTTTTVNAFVNPSSTRSFSVIQKTTTSSYNNNINHIIYIHNINSNIMSDNTPVDKKLKTTALAAVSDTDTDSETSKVSADEYKEALLAARNDIDKLLAENACGKLAFLQSFDMML
jgi:hypothetical protein